MSYARWGEDGSDVYVFGMHTSKDDADDCIVCMDCMLHPVHESFSCKTPTEMLAHLKEHVIAGHKVPKRAWVRLAEEESEGK